MNNITLLNNTNNQHYGSFFTDSEYRQMAITSLLLLVFMLICVICCCYWSDRRDKRKQNKNQFKQPKNQLSKLTFVQFPMSVEKQGLSSITKRRNSSSLHDNSEINIELPKGSEIDDEVIGSRKGDEARIFTLDMDEEEKNKVECDEFLAKAEDNTSLLEEKYGKSEITS